MKDRYLFTSERLGFRCWLEEDIPAMAALNADPDVMRFFPATQGLPQTTAFVHRMSQMFQDKGFCYFAVETLADGHFIGFTGLSEPNYEAPFTPCIDIGWRLQRSAWGNGYATEGALRCLQHAFYDLGLSSVRAVAPEANRPSIQVMEKIGMKKIMTFRHPALLAHEALVNCVCYEAQSGQGG